MLKTNGKKPSKKEVLDALFDPKVRTILIAIIVLERVTGLTLEQWASIHLCP